MSEVQQLNVPSLRFPEFSGEWEAKTLGDFFTFKNGVNADKSMYGRGRKFINVLDVIADSPIYYDKIIGEVDISDTEFAKNEVKFGDVLFQRSSETREEVGQSNIYLDTVSATFGGFIIRGRPTREIESRYFHALLKTAAVRKDLTSRSGGSTRYNIGQEALEGVSVVVAPTLSEQQKIAAFLGTVDARAALLRRRRETLRAYKKGIMQRLFSRELRFTKADGSPFPDWEAKQLGELGEFAGGGTPDTNVPEYWTGKTPWVSSSDITEDSVHHVSLTRYISQAAIQDSSTKIIPANSILIVARVGVGKLAISPVKLCTSQDFCNFTPRNENAVFLAYLLLHNKNRLLSLCQGTSIKGLTTIDLRALKLEIPHLGEQVKIAGFLSSLDNKIDAVTAQLSANLAFKKGLLQQMFV